MDYLIYSPHKNLINSAEIQQSKLGENEIIGIIVPKLLIISGT